MLLVKNNSTEPYFNMATEEYLINSSDLPVIMLWRNENAVIIGKNQNAAEQLNLDYVEKNKINVVRRLSGGGAVFHDIGNVNYTFIAKSEGGLDFEYFCRPIIEALATLVVKCHLSGRNDIVTDDGELKFSGTAQCTQIVNGEKRILHHGTLLFSADMSHLVGALNVDEEKIKSKGIKSVRSRVTNIAPLINSPMTALAFKEYLEDYFLKKYNAVEKSFDENDIAAINALAKDIESTKEWIYGETSTNLASKKHRFSFGTVQISFSTKKQQFDVERIEKMDIFGDFSEKMMQKTLQSAYTVWNLLKKAWKTRWKK